MKYLFFDIECSNCYDKEGKICEFGYTILNEQGEKEFPTYYERIKARLEDNNNIIIGFSAENDLQYLSYTCSRYGLDMIHFKCYDIQKINSIINGEKNKRSLKNIFIEMFGHNEYIKYKAHCAKYDAEMVSKIFIELCNRKKLSLKQFLEEYKSCMIDSIEYLNSIKNKSHRKANRNKWRKLCKEMIDSSEQTPIQKTMTISSCFYDDNNLFKELVLLVKKLKLVPVKKVEEAEIAVCVDEIDLNRLNIELGDKYAIKLMTFVEYKKTIYCENAVEI